MYPTRKEWLVVGACYACVCKNKNQEGYKRICKEGPVFQAGEVEI